MLIGEYAGSQILLDHQNRSTEILGAVRSEIDHVFAGAVRRAEALGNFGLQRDLKTLQTDIVQCLTASAISPFHTFDSIRDQKQSVPTKLTAKTSADHDATATRGGNGLAPAFRLPAQTPRIVDAETLSRSLDVLEQFCGQISHATYVRLLNSVAAAQKTVHRAGADTFSVFNRICYAANGHRLPALERGISSDLLEEMASDLLCAEEAAWDEYEACQQRLPSEHSAPRKRTPTAVYSHSEREIPAVILKARSLTSGKTLFLMGGECRPEQKASIETLLDCTVKWLPSNGAASVKRIHTAGAGCHVLCALITLMRKGESAALNALHRDSGVPLVRVLAKVSATSIAAAICEQLMRE